MVRDELLKTPGEKPNVIVLFTDGGSNDYSRTLLEAAAVSLFYLLLKQLALYFTGRNESLEN